MDLSVIIVNYNVKYFLEQCLYSVRTAAAGLNVEVFVVDNNSTDGSQEMLREKFPEIQLIENRENKGFSRANNQAIKISKGRYVLLLNPDTVVQEDTFQKCVAFMDDHLEGGGLGVTMVDGGGNFLPESKRGLPTPAVAFYKIFGLSSLFPKSKKFGKYHLKYLDKNQTHEVEILAGAFMMIRKETIDKVGMLDEDFFMYGEDIDWSYRIVLGGYKNYYFSETRIIHYKGESTKKSSVNYVFVFYRAMIIFAKKHFHKNWKWFCFFINIAIWLRAALAIVSRFFNAIFLKPFSQCSTKRKLLKTRIAIVGSQTECRRVKTLMLNVLPKNFVGQIGFVVDKATDDKFEKECFGTIKAMPDIIRKFKINEIVFCATDIALHEIIQMMMDWNSYRVEYKIVPPHSNFMVGSHSIQEF